MAKLLTMFMILIAIQACLLIYQSPDAQDSSFWNFLTNLDNWNNLSFILSWFTIASAIGLTGIVAGTMFGFKTDFLIMAPVIAGFISMGFVFSQLATVIRNELISRVFYDVCPGVLVDGVMSFPCSPANWIIAVTIGPIAFIYVWTVIDWWRGKDY